LGGFAFEHGKAFSYQQSAFSSAFETHGRVGELTADS
jgi:hypothetical protein